MKELEKLSDEALDHRLHYVRGLCPEGIAVIVPRYTADLNECAKVEEGLTENQQGDFINALCTVCEPDRSKPGTAMSKAFFASARQRTTALIATLEAK